MLTRQQAESEIERLHEYITKLDMIGASANTNPEIETELHGLYFEASPILILNISDCSGVPQEIKTRYRTSRGIKEYTFKRVS